MCSTGTWPSCGVRSCTLTWKIAVQLAKGAALHLGQGVDEAVGHGVEVGEVAGEDCSHVWGGWEVGLGLGNGVAAGGQGMRAGTVGIFRDRTRELCGKAVMCSRHTGRSAREVCPG